MFSRKNVSVIFSGLNESGTIFKTVLTNNALIPLLLHYKETTGKQMIVKVVSIFCCEESTFKNSISTDKIKLEKEFPT